MRKRRTRSNKNPFSVSQEPELWDEYNEELINMKESLFVDKWHDTCELLPDCDNVWFIADGKICVGMYEPEQKVFCMADGMGFELKNVRQWKFVGMEKQIAKFPNEKQIIAVSIPKLPCLATGIFTDHCIDEKTGDEVSAVILDWNMGIVPFKEVSYWFEIPAEPLVVLDPVGDAPLAILPAAEELTINNAEPAPAQEECVCEDAEKTDVVDNSDVVVDTDRDAEGNDLVAHNDDESVKSSIAKAKADLDKELDKDNDPIKNGIIQESVDKSRKSDNVKSWYKKNYPTDELGDEINPNLTFEEAYDSLKNGVDIYYTLDVGDSLVRERLFNELSDIYDVDYDVIYHMWLDSASDDYFSLENEDSNKISDDKEKEGLKYIEDYKQGLFDLPELHKRILKLFDGDYKASVEWLYDAWNKTMKESKLKEAKIYYELTNGNYQPWSGAVDTWDSIVDNDRLEDFDRYLEDLYPDGISETELNDLLWFDGDQVLEDLGIKDSYDYEDEKNDEDDEEEEEEEEEQPIAEESYKGFDIYTWGGDLITICKNDRYKTDADSVEDAKRIIDEGKID